jgi:cold-inducible RNA-binding protein
VASINIYVGNLSFDTNEDQLRELFETYGQVESATIISDKFTGRPRGFGFVKMPEREEGLKAIKELDARDFMGRNIKVNEARPRTDRGGGGGGDRGDRSGRGDRQGGGGRGERWR